MDLYQFKEIENQRILLSFLTWGKGHLSRCIGVCRELTKQNNTIFIACSNEDFEILKSYIPTLHHLSFPDYPFHFEGKGNFANDLWKTRKKLVKFIDWEQKEVEKLVKSTEISLVISDQRYGFRSNVVPSIFITHQVNLALKWWQKPAQWLHQKWMNQFSFVWIMDDENNSLAGKLSQGKKLKNKAYIGHFSRFSIKNCEKNLQIGVCNGPAPYNQQLLEKLVQNNNLDWIISTIPHADKRVVSAENWQTTDELFYKAEVLYGYCGYSTLMDIKILGCKAQLIPTPGQAEQEYLYRLIRFRELFEEITENFGEVFTKPF